MTCTVCCNVPGSDVYLSDIVKDTRLSIERSSREITKNRTAGSDKHIGKTKNQGNLIKIPTHPESDIHPSQCISAVLLNTRSVNNKSAIIKDFIVDHDIDLAFLNETWLVPDQKFINEYMDDMLPTDTGRDKHIIKSLLPKGYKIIHFPRIGSGGGNGVIYKDNLVIAPQKASTRQRSFEYMELLIKLEGNWLRFILVYRPPPSTENKLNVPMFLSELTNLLEEITVANHETVLLGDFNFHCESNCSNAATFLELLDLFGFNQRVNFPTNDFGHTLDLIITREIGQTIITNIHCHDPMISDHKAILFDILSKKPCFSKQKIVYRKWKTFNEHEFQKDLVIELQKQTDFERLKSTYQISHTPNEVEGADSRCYIDSVEECMAVYNEVLSTLLDKHAPIRENNITVKPHAPWYNRNIDSAKRERRRREHKWLKSKMPADRLEYKKQCKIVSDLIFMSKKCYYNEKINAATGNQKELFKIINNVFHNKKVKKLPSHETLEKLTQHFSDFFVNKIEKIRNSFSCSTIFADDVNNDLNESQLMFDFKPIDDAEIRKLLMQSHDKYCYLDPIPTSLLKKCAHILIPLITLIVNMSLSSGYMPRDLKRALLMPMLKKVIDDPETFSNFRPISNLPFLSKLIEKVVADQLISHMTSNNLLEVLQSSYKKYHSTETALTCVLDDIIRGIDDKKCALLLLLDLSSGFDTVDHNIIIERMENDWV